MSERENPYVGLRPFFVGDSLFFFGREEQIAELLTILHEHRFLGIVGSSGSGKSSLVRAGLLPSLLGGFLVEDRDTWRLAQVRPGDAPMANLTDGLVEAFGNALTPEERDALETAIREDGVEAVRAFLCSRLDRTRESLFLLVDQFEEIFAFRRAAGSAATDEESPERTRERSRRQTEAADYVALLMGLSEQADLPIYVALTMRTDFLGDCDLFYGFPEILNKGQYLVPRLTRQQLRRAIEGPAKLNGARLAPRLLDHLLNELGDRSDRLPVLQHALQRTWDAWTAAGAAGPIDLPHYEAAGGLEGALNQDAEAALAGLDERTTARVFRRITDTDAGQRAVRSPARISELVAASAADRTVVESIVSRFRGDGRNFLYVSSDGNAADPRVDISHESLIRQWERLRRWVAEERASRDQFRALAEQARRWSMSGAMESWRRLFRPPAGEEAGGWFARTMTAMHASMTRGSDDLLRGSVLRQYRRWNKREAPTAGWAERYAEQPDDFRLATRFLRASIWSRRFRIMTPIVILVVGFVAWGVAAEDRREVQRQREERLDATRALEVQVSQVRDPEVALLLGLYAVENYRTLDEEPPFSLETALLRRWQESAVVATERGSGTTEAGVIGDDHVSAVLLSPDATLVAAAHEDRRAVTADRRARLDTARGAYISVWDLRPKAVLPHIGTDTDPVTMVCGALTRTGTLVAVDADQVAREFDVHNGTPVAATPRVTALTTPAANFRCAVSPDGRALAMLEWDGRWKASVWRLGPRGTAPRRTAVMVLEGSTEFFLPTATFSPDSAKVAVVDPIWFTERKVRVVDVATGRVERVIDSAAGVSALAFDHSHRHLAIAADATGRVAVWDWPDNHRVDMGADAEATDQSYADLAFSPDDTRLVGVGYTATVWNANSGDRLRTFGGYDDSIWTAAFITDDVVVTAGRDGHVKRWNADPQAIVVSVKANDASQTMFTPDGESVAYGEGEAVRTWNIKTGRPGRSFEHAAGMVSGVDFSVEGVVAAGADTGTVTLWNPGGTLRSTLRGPGGSIGAVAFSPNGRHLAAAAGDKVRIWTIGPSTGEARPADVEGRTLVVPTEMGANPGDRDIITITFVGDAVLGMTTNGGANMLWDVSSGNRVTTIDTTSRTLSAAFVPLRNRLITGDLDGRVHFVDLDQAEGEHVLKQHRNWITSVAVSPDHRRFATASYDKTAVIWDIEALLPIVVLPHTGPLERVVFSPDSEHVLTTSLDTYGEASLRVWSVPHDEDVVARALERVTRALTLGECQRYNVLAEGDSQKCRPMPTLESLAPGRKK